MEPCDNVRVSVIIPVFNAEKNLRQCLDSVLCQTERSIEVICIDDGSTDGSLGILNDYSSVDSRVVVLRQENRGGGSARNLGIDAARGKYLSFLDADDFFDKDLVKSATDALDASGADIAVYRSWVFREEDQSVYDAGWTYRADLIPSKSVFTYRDMPDAIFNAFANVPWNKMFRSSFVQEKQIRFQQIQRTNDLLFVCSALVLARGIVAIDRHLAYYRMGNVSSCQATNDRAPLAFYEAFLALKSFLLELGLFDLLQTSFVRHALDGIVANLNSQNSLEGFRAIFQLRADFESQFGIRKHADAILDVNQLAEYEDMLDSDEAAFLYGRLKLAQSERDEARRKNRAACVQIRETEKRVVKLRREIALLARERDCLNERNASLQDSCEGLSGELTALRQSRSYRIGRAVTAPYRYVRGHFS